MKATTSKYGKKTPYVFVAAGGSAAGPDDLKVGLVAVADRDFIWANPHGGLPWPSVEPDVEPRLVGCAVQHGVGVVVDADGDAGSRHVALVGVGEQRVELGGQLFGELVECGVGLVGLRRVLAQHVDERHRERVAVVVLGCLEGLRPPESGCLAGCPGLLDGLVAVLIGHVFLLPLGVERGMSFQHLVYVCCCMPQDEVFALAMRVKTSSHDTRLSNFSFGVTSTKDGNIIAYADKYVNTWLGLGHGNITFEGNLDFDISEIESIYEGDEDTQ